MLQRQLIEETGFSLSQSVPVPRERRRDQRHMRIFRVATLVVEGRRELCMIRNLSACGLMAHVYSPIATGQRVAFEFKTGQQISGKVVWTRGANAGVAFDEPIDVTELLVAPAPLENGWRPRMPRIEVDRPATVRSGATTHRVTVRDISLGGLKAEIAEPLEDGGEVVVKLEDFPPISGTVRWRRGGLCGIAFNQVIPFRELIEWLKRGA